MRVVRVQSNGLMATEPSTSFPSLTCWRKAVKLAMESSPGNGGGVLTARDHQDLGRCLCRLGSVGLVNQFHDKSVDPATMCDDQETPTISWPNFNDLDLV